MNLNAISLGLYPWASEPSMNFYNLKEACYLSVYLLFHPLSQGYLTDQSHLLNPDENKIKITLKRSHTEWNFELDAYLLIACEGARELSNSSISQEFT